MRERGRGGLRWGWGFDETRGLERRSLQLLGSSHMPQGCVGEIGCCGLCIQSFFFFDT